MRYLFNDFELEPDKFELRKGGAPVALEPQVFSLLQLLVENRERVVSKDEIIEKIWDGGIVSDASVASRIKSARQATGDNGASQHTIRTVHRRGFRFVAPTKIRAENRIMQYPGATGLLLPDAQIADPGLNSKPSIVVLPFQLLGASTELGAIADAIPHELIQALSRLRWLFVIARGSAFRFRAADPDVREICGALNVRYCLSGSVEISDRTIAVTVELSDASDGGVLWGERFSSAFEDVHEIRSRIVTRVVSSLEVHIPMNEARVARLGVSENLDSWSNYHLALRHMYRFTMQDNAKATALFERAVSQDAQFARAYAGLSFTHFQDAFMKYGGSARNAAKDARRFAERSVELDPLDPFANFTMGRSFWLEGELESSVDWLERSTSLSPSYAQGYYARGFTAMLGGNADQAKKNVDAAQSLSPFDPLLYGMLGTRALSYIIEGDYQNAALWAEKAARAPGSHFLIALIAVVAHSLDQNRERTLFWIADVRRRRPNVSKTHFFDSFPFSDPGIRKRISDALKPYGI